MALDKRTIAFIGAGHITGILLNNLVTTGKLMGRQLVASDPNQDKLQRLLISMESSWRTTILRR